MSDHDGHSWWRNPLCAPRTDPLLLTAPAWQRTPGGQLVAAAVAALPLVVLALWMHLSSDEPTLTLMLGGPLIGGSLLIFWVAAVNRFLSADRLAALGLRTDKIGLEILLGVVGGILLLGLHLAMSPLLQRMFQPQPAPPEIIELMDSLSRRPAMLALWLGPVVWIGVALFEELWRVHLLRRLWCVWPGTPGRWIVIVFAAAVVAGMHLYQPPAVMLSIFLLSLLKGAFFLATGRFWTLVVAHAVYDSIQIGMMFVAVRGAAG